MQQKIYPKKLSTLVMILVLCTTVFAAGNYPASGDLNADGSLPSTYGYHELRHVVNGTLNDDASPKWLSVDADQDGVIDMAEKVWNQQQKCGVGEDGYVLKYVEATQIFTCQEDSTVGGLPGACANGQHLEWNAGAWGCGNAGSDADWDVTTNVPHMFTGAAITGNVGIGDATPGEKLTISTVGGAVDTKILMDADNGEWISIDMAEAGAGRWGFGKDNNDHFYIDETSADTRLFIEDSTGNVGIAGGALKGSTAAKLHVLQGGAANIAKFARGANEVTIDQNAYLGILGVPTVPLDVTGAARISGELDMTGGNIQLNANYISNDGTSNGISIDGSNDVDVSGDLTAAGQVCDINGCIGVAGGDADWQTPLGANPGIADLAYHNNNIGVGDFSGGDPIDMSIHVKAGQDANIKLHDTAGTGGTLAAYLQFFSAAGREGYVGLDANANGDVKLRAENGKDIQIQAAGDIQMLSDTVTNDNWLTNDGTASEGIFLETGGQVGIGTGTPAALLDVDGSSQFNGLMTMTAGSSNIRLNNNYLSNDGTANGISIDASNDIVVSSDLTAAGVICDSTGCIGGTDGDWTKVGGGSTSRC